MSDSVKEGIKKILDNPEKKFSEQELHDILERDDILRIGGERLQAWFNALMDEFISNARLMNMTRGFVRTQEYINGISETLFNEVFKKVSNPENQEWLRSKYRESVKAIGLKFEQSQKMEGVIRIGEKPSLIMDKQPPRYEDAYLASQIGGGKVQRHKNAE